jgi:site-specific DNA-methyltransferase (adenine-specific)
VKTELFLHNSEGSIVRCGGQGYLTCLDGLVFLRSLRSEIADIVFLDPPFNLGKDYGFSSALENGKAEAYEAYVKSVLTESTRILKPGGALFMYHLPFWASRLSAELHMRLRFRHWIAIAMKNGFAWRNYLYPAHYALLYFTKGEPTTFFRPRTAPQYCRHCDELVKDYGGYTRIIERKGLNLSDFWDDLSPVRHDTRKHRSSNQLPPLLTDRVVRMAGRKGGMLIDPFAGTGTCLVSAVGARMKFVGNDMSRPNLRLCRLRIVEALERRKRSRTRDSA